MKFNTNNKNLRRYLFLDFIEDNYEDLFNFYKDNFYNPQTGEKSEQAFNQWFSKNKKGCDNPIETEKRIRYIKTREYPIWVTYPNGNTKLQNFKHMYDIPCWCSMGRYVIDNNVWEHFSYVEPDKYKESDSEKVSSEHIQEIKEFVNKFGKLLCCIKSSAGIVAYYKTRDWCDILKQEEFKLRFKNKHNINLHLHPYKNSQGTI